MAAPIGALPLAPAPSRKEASASPDVVEVCAATVEAIRGFFSDTEAWLAALLLEGRRAGVVAFAGPAGTVAQALLSAVEGAMLTARAFGDLGRFDAAVKWHLARLKP